MLPCKIENRPYSIRPSTVYNRLKDKRFFPENCVPLYFELAIYLPSATAYYCCASHLGSTDMTAFSHHPR